MDKNTIAIALGSLLVGGVAVAAYQNVRHSDPVVPATSVQATTAAPGDAPNIAVTDPAMPVVGSEPLPAQEIVTAPPPLEYATVTNVKPVSNKQAIYATVIGTDPVRETSTSTTPREVCQDVVVQQRQPERDGNVGGTVVGAVVGGLIGNQIGGGRGRQAATAAGAVAGGFVGNRVDRNHVGGQVTNVTERQCHTVNDQSQSSRVVGYNVTYRNPDGTTGNMRVGSKPGNRIQLGSEQVVVGYDVTYDYQGQRSTVRMQDNPGQRLPVIDGKVVTQTAAVQGASSKG